MTLKVVVVTVPPDCTEAQRQEIKVLAEASGWEARNLMNEAVAAALILDLDDIDGVRHVLVYDLGGASFKATSLLFEDGIFDVIATEVDTRIGGHQFTKRLWRHLCLALSLKTRKTCDEDASISSLLYAEAERAKIALSTHSSIEIPVSQRFQKSSLRETITREKFEELCSDLINASVAPIDKVLQKANISKHDIDDVAIVGGSSNMPKLRSIHLMTVFENQTKATIKVFAGERPRTMHNIHLVTAQGASMSSRLTVSFDEAQWSDERCEEILRDAEIAYESDLKEKKSIEARNSLNDLLHDVKTKLFPDSPVTHSAISLHSSSDAVALYDSLSTPSPLPLTQIANEISNDDRRKLVDLVEEIATWRELHDATAVKEDLEAQEMRLRDAILALTSELPRTGREKVEL
ncbi:ATPase with role in protein import into the ER [Phlyctochytrium bullatum]|nr:ATPase with role in protein import into the ER [Phlyctochytrium bullatum]